MMLPVSDCVVVLEQALVSETRSFALVPYPADLASPPLLVAIESIASPLNNLSFISTQRKPHITSITAHLLSNSNDLTEQATMSDIEQKTELFDEQQEETRANQAIDSDVQREEARGEAADGDYTDAQYYGNNSYLEAPFSSPLLLFGAHSLSPPLSFGEQLPVSSSRKRKPQTALSTITSEQADSVLGNPIENSGEEEQQNSVTVVLSGKQVLLPCLRTFETGTYTRGTGNDPDEPDNVEMFGASNITGQVTPPSGLYDDAGQVVLRSLASGPSNVVTTSMLMGRDRASKDRAKANKDKNKETKLFPQFENKMGSPKMTNVPFGEPAVVQTSVGLRYLAADDRYVSLYLLLFIHTNSYLVQCLVVMPRFGTSM